MTTLFQRLQDARLAPRIAVVGDLMIDKHVQCDVEGISPEDDLAWKVRVVETSYKPGGAANVAANVRELGADTHVFGAVGRDDGAGLLRYLLSLLSIQHVFDNSDPGRVTTVKTRYLSRRGRHILRVDREHTHMLTNPSFLPELLAAGGRRWDAVVVSDYAKGVVSRELIERIEGAGLCFLVDPKRRDILAYGKNARLLTPNEKELRLMSSAQAEAPIPAVFAELPAAVPGQFIVLTRGEKGAELWRSEDGRWEFKTRFEVRGRRMGDPAGCGDSLLAALAFAIACGWDIDSAWRVAVAAGACAFDQVGVCSVSRSALLRELGTFNYEEGANENRAKDWNCVLSARPVDAGGLSKERDGAGLRSAVDTSRRSGYGDGPAGK